MKYLPQLNTILLLGAVVLQVLIFRGCGSTKDDQKLVEAKDEIIRIERENTTRERARADAAILELIRVDSLLKLKVHTTTIKYATIPVYINSLNRDSLRAAVERFRPN